MIGIEPYLTNNQDGSNHDKIKLISKRRGNMSGPGIRSSERMWGYLHKGAKNFEECHRIIKAERERTKFDVVIEVIKGAT